MRACNCTLPLEACKSCPIYLENQNIFSEPPYVYYPNIPNSKTKRITKTVKKYDKRGKLKGEHITIWDEVVFDNPNLPTIYWNDGTGAPNPYKTTTTTAANNDNAQVDHTKAYNIPSGYYPSNSDIS